jgi:hypothetical protein
VISIRPDEFDNIRTDLRNHENQTAVVDARMFDAVLVGRRSRPCHGLRTELRTTSGATRQSGRRDCAKGDRSTTVPGTNFIVIFIFPRRLATNSVSVATQRKAKTRWNRSSGGTTYNRDRGL